MSYFKYFLFPSLGLSVLCSVSVTSSLPWPSWQSDWLDLEAQSNTGSYRAVTHGIGELPLLVRVLVKAVDGPNKDFIFQATGVPSSDAQNSGVVYTYNQTVVRVFVQNTKNTGKA